MGRIYSCCRQAYVWLGIPPSQRSLGPCNPFALAEHLADDKHLFEVPTLHKRDQVLKTLPFKNLGDHSTLAQGLRMVLQSSWWSRVWCVQEVRLPPTAAVVFGHWRIDWGRLEAGLQNWSHHASGYCNQAKKCQSRKYEDPDLDELLNHDDHFEWVPHPYLLDVTLRLYRYKDASDPRDKVFGMLGILDQHQDTAAVRPDYSQKLPEVLVATTRAISQSTPYDLCWMTGNGFRSNIEGVPSWVRDLSQRCSVKVMQIEKTRMTTYFLYAGRGLCPDQGNGPCVSFCQSPSVCSLVARGLRVGRVHATSKEMPHTGNVVTILLALKAWLKLANSNRTVTDRVAAVAESISGVKLAFWRTLVGDTILDYTMSISSRRRAAADGLPKILMYPYRRINSSNNSEDAKELSAWIDSLPLTWNKPFTMLLQQRFLLHFASKWFLAAAVATAGRRFFLTRRDGDYEALASSLGSPEVAVGDEVWVLHGGRVPFVLRPELEGAVAGQDAQSKSRPGCRQVFTFVGDCYVHDALDGEATEGRGCQAQEILLL